MGAEGAAQGPLSAPHLHTALGCPTCWATEKAPEIIDWDPMIAASVATTTMGQYLQGREKEKNEIPVDVDSSQTGVHTKGRDEGRLRGRACCRGQQPSWVPELGCRSAAEELMAAGRAGPIGCHPGATWQQGRSAVPADALVCPRAATKQHSRQTHTGFGRAAQ